MRSEIISKMTKELFANSLKKLMREKLIEKITVKEISEDCGLNRRTFYRHFKDIYDLLEWICKTEIDEKIHESLDFQHWQLCFYDLLDYFYENKEISYSLIRFSNRKYIETFICNSINKIIINVIENNKELFNLSDYNEKFLCNFYSLSFTALLLQWIESGMKESPEKLVKNISKILEGSIGRITNES
ncbi:TetR/AcrR family transcriptional regulator C-terminal domain-containing protein [Clostridium sp. LIBA-8841]|uniref:TetR/AcrR family transcriptional regulator C-terminal domain-containing protein n=1 Tax=Clostridium sp. LIBA-8841 TaxID=2987530 RepID=UPI002AC5E576|nr:TetR/AcrR family transcriptional regulator C-terminal domain-containing protein [Clostridium sp. LIBA-8841]MDZ5254448.1 TetR/AcrR family transcriptional regulator [Clostridium sp. LIBA-8841]